MEAKSESKIAVVTGGNRGLGKSTALHLAKRNVGVVLTYRSNEAEAKAVVAEIVQGGGKAVALPLDVSNVGSFSDFAGQVKTALQQTWKRERFDHLVNNAGTGLHKPFVETTEADLDDMYRVHFKGTFFLTQKLLPLLQDGGRIVNLSSGLARFSFPGSSAYASMKGAVETLTRYLARELGPRGIAVNTLAPGAIETDFGGGRVRDNKEMNQQIASMTAMGRVGLPDDIGGAIASLLSEENRWITGQRIEVSGGMLL